PHQDVFTDPLSPVVLLARTMQVFPQRIGVVSGDTRWTYARFGEEVGRMAGALRRAGVGPGDRVAVLAPNTEWHLVAHFAMPLLAAPLVSINTRLASAEIAHILRHCGAKILLVDPELADRIDAIRDDLPDLERVIEIPDASVSVRPGKESYEHFASGADVLPIVPSVDDELTVISINYTSGTTGMPKGVMYTHRAAALNALGHIGAMKLDHESVFLWTLPMFHCNGWCMPWAITAAGGRHVCLRKIDPPEALRILTEEKVTHFNGAPTVLLMLGSDPAAKDLRFDPPIHVCTGGAPPSPTLLERMERLGFRIQHLYGLTETYGPHVFCEMQSEWGELAIPARAE
ncbi:MAG: AMP-binding protein, partial [Polyangiaceae bacterium]|nr:AMP-binding protein [Polyangiaceae bacterium]